MTMRISRSTWKHRLLLNSLDRTRRTGALFLDRDGVIIEDMNHIKSAEEVCLRKGAAEIIREAVGKDIPVIVVTNQSGIGRGFFGWDDYERVSFEMIRLLGRYSKITAIYANGFTPECPNSMWRKPNPGMILAAAREFDIDLSKSILIGDRLSDLNAGATAGLKHLWHVISKQWTGEREKISAWERKGTREGKSPTSWSVGYINQVGDFPVRELDKACVDY